MDDYISREAAIKTVSGWYRKALHPENMSSYNEGERDAYRTALSEIAILPAADVRPVVRGKWIQTTQPMGWRDEDCAECSVCGEDFVLDEWAMDEFTNLMNFCPNCGADMKTGAE